MNIYIYIYLQVHTYDIVRFTDIRIWSLYTCYVSWLRYNMLPKTYPTTNTTPTLMLNERSLIERLKMFACGWMFHAPRCSVCWRVTDEKCIEMNTPWIILGYFSASCFCPTGLLCWQQTSMISIFYIFLPTSLKMWVEGVDEAHYRTT